jgi:hypothetical protein
MIYLFLFVAGSWLVDAKVIKEIAIFDEMIIRYGKNTLKIMM